MSLYQLADRERSGMQIGDAGDSSHVQKKVPAITDMTPACPYPGLDSYCEQDAGLFIGREQVTHRLVRAMITEPLVCLIGPARSGKTSILQAGLIPELRRAQSNWLIVPTSLGQYPCQSLARSFVSLLHEGYHSNLEAEAQEMAQRLARGSLSMMHVARTILQARPHAQRLLLVFDHIESLYAPHVPAEARESFLSELLASTRAVRAHGRMPLSVLLSMRAEAMERALSDSSMADLLQSPDVKLGPMSRADLSRAITVPASAYGVQFEPGLADRMLDVVSQRPGRPGLLQFTLRSLWMRQDNGKLTHAVYDELGGVEKALDQHVEAFYRQLSVEQQRRAIQLIEQLSLRDEGSSIPEDSSLVWQDAVGKDVASRLIEAGFVIRHPDTPGDYRFTCDEVAAAWRHLSSRAGNHHSAQTPSREAQSGRWATPENQHQTALSRHLTAQAELLSQDSRTLQQSALLAIEALRRSDSGKANHVLRHALALLPRPVARLMHHGAIQVIAFAPDGTHLASGGQDGLARLWHVESGNLVFTMPHHSAVTHLAFSTDGSYLLTACASGDVQIWETTTFQHLTTVTHHGGIHQVIFSPNGQYIATAGSDGAARIWEAATGRESACLPHDANVTDLSFGPDSQTLATASADHCARVWRISDGQLITHTTHRDGVTSVAFSPDGRYVASASSDHTVALWRATNNQQLALIVHQASVNQVTFSQSGKYLATASDDHTTQVWHVADHREVMRVSHTMAIGQVAFSHDEQLLLTSGHDHTARVWDLSSGSEVACISSDQPIIDIAFSPDGQRVATASQDGTARVWMLMGKESTVLHHKDVVSDVAFSPDGQMLVTASWDRTAHIWNADSFEEIQQVLHSGNLNAVTFSPDGKLLGTASGSYFSTARDDTARLWEVASGCEVMRMVHDGPVRAISFHPSGQYVATVSEDHTLRVWDIASNIEIRRILFDEPVVAASYSPDSHLLAIGSGQTVSLWDGRVNRELARLDLPGEIKALAFSPDGNRLAAAGVNGNVRVWHDPLVNAYTEISYDGLAHAVAFNKDSEQLGVAGADRTVRIFEVNGGKEIVRIEQDETLTSLAFSPDGRYLATGSYDSKCRLWLLESQDLIHEACQRLTHALTPDEWQQYLGDEPYNPACVDTQSTEPQSHTYAVQIIDKDYAIG